MLVDVTRTLLLIGFSLCALAALIVVIGPLVRRIGGAQWSYALWLLLLAPLAFQLIPNHGWQAWPTDAAAADALDSLTTALAGSLSNASLGLLILIWIIGTVAFATTLSIRYRRFRSKILQDAEQVPMQQQAAFVAECEKVGIFPVPRVVSTRYLSTAALLGIVAPTVVLPFDFFRRFSAAEQGLMLRHELMHLKRHDIWWNLLFSAARCFFWFVPLASLAERRFRAAQECACDHAVVWDEPQSVRLDYAAAMFKTVTGRPEAASVIAFLNTKHDVVTRVAALEHHRRTLPRALFGFCTILMMVTTIVLILPGAEASPNTLGNPFGWCAIYSDLGL